MPESFIRYLLIKGLFNQKCKAAVFHTLYTVGPYAFSYGKEHLGHKA